MGLTLNRLLGTIATTAVVALVIAFFTRHAKHGFGLYLGDLAWITFLASLLLTLLLGIAALARLARARRVAAR
jgi:hypothetical protein